MLMCGHELERSLMAIRRSGSMLMRGHELERSLMVIRIMIPHRMRTCRHILTIFCMQEIKLFGLK